MADFAFTSSPAVLLEAVGVLTALGAQRIGVVVTAGQSANVEMVATLDGRRIGVKVDAITSVTAGSKIVDGAALRAALALIPTSVTSCSLTYDPATSNQGVSVPATWTLAWGSNPARTMKVQELEGQ